MALTVHSPTRIIYQIVLLITILHWIIFGFIYLIHGLHILLRYGLIFFPLEYLDKDKEILYGSSKLNMNQVSAYFVFFVSLQLYIQKK